MYLVQGSEVRIIPRQRVSLLCWATGLIFVGFLARTLLTSRNYLILSAAGSAGLRLRLSLLRHLDRLSADYYESTPVGAVLYPFKEPIEGVSYFGSDLVASIVRTFLTTCFTFSGHAHAESGALTIAILPLVPVFPPLLSRGAAQKLTVDSDNVQCSPVGMYAVSGGVPVFSHCDTTAPDESIAREASPTLRGR